MRTRYLLGLGLCICCAGSIVAARADVKSRFPAMERREYAPVTWYTVNEKLTQELRQADLGQLAQQALRAPKPKTAEEWLKRLAIFARAEYRTATQNLLRSRPAFLPKTQAYGLHSLVAEARSVDDLELSKRLCELFPEQTDGGNWFGAWANQTAPEIVERWLATQSKTENSAWMRLRLKFLAEKNQEQPLLEEFAAQVRKHPESDVAVEDYLAAVGATEKKQNTEWLAETVKFPLAAPYYFLSRQFSNDPKTLIALLERARAIPFTPAEDEWFREYAQRRHFNYLGPRFVLTEAQLSQWIDAGLMDAYKRAGQADKAQALLEKITTSNPNGLPTAFQAFNAGQIQAGSGARVIEQNIIKAEETEAETPQYWLQRAEYYAGRKEEKPAVEAYEKALSLAPIKNDYTDAVRSQILSQYVRLLWLKDVEQPTEAFALLRRELKLAPPASDYARGIVAEMMYHDSDTRRYISGDDSDLWRFVLAQKDLGGQARSVVRVLLERAPKENRDAAYGKVEEILASRDANQWSAWGDILLGQQEHKRAVVWLQKASAGKLDADKVDTTLLSLWRAYEGINDWRSMETLLSASPRLFASANYLMNIAVAAAQDGKTEIGEKYFRLWANQDRRLAPSFYPLPSLGLLDFLQTYYRNLAQREPESETPRRIKKSVGIG